jgi:hypothetical protein
MRYDASLKSREYVPSKQYRQLAREHTFWFPGYNERSCTTAELNLEYVTGLVCVCLVQMKHLEYIDNNWL